MAMFGELLVQLDPWQVDYGTELPLDEADEAADDETAWRSMSRSRGMIGRRSGLVKEFTRRG